MTLLNLEGDLGPTWLDGLGAPLEWWRGAGLARALMLRPDVVQAIADGHFHIQAIDTVEDGIELLTGIPAGNLDAKGDYPDHTVYGAVQARLQRFREALAIGRM